VQGVVQLAVRSLAGRDTLDVDNLVSVSGELLEAGKKG